jgi:hypothetical protein
MKTERVNVAVGLRNLQWTQSMLGDSPWFLSVSPGALLWSWHPLLRVQGCQWVRAIPPPLPCSCVSLGDLYLLVARLGNGTIFVEFIADLLMPAWDVESDCDVPWKEDLAVRTWVCHVQLKWRVMFIVAKTCVCKSEFHIRINQELHEYSETNVVRVLFSLLRINVLYIFRALLILRRVTQAAFGILRDVFSDVVHTPRH